MKKLLNFNKIFFILLIIFNIILTILNYSYAEGPIGPIIEIIDSNSLHLKTIRQNCKVIDYVPGVGEVKGYGYEERCYNTSMISICNPTPCKVNIWVYPSVDVNP